jgi:hypothetical protein
MQGLRQNTTQIVFSGHRYYRKPSVATMRPPEHLSVLDSHAKPMAHPKL